MIGFLKIYLIIGYVINIIYQINCVIEYEKDLEYAREKFGIYSSDIEMDFDYIGTILGGYMVMFLWPIELMTAI